MKMKQSSYVLSGVFGAFMWVVAFALGGAVVLVTNVPLLGGLVQVLILACLFAINSMIVQRFGAMTIQAVVFTIISWPTIVFGPPGWYKIPVGLVLGLTVDIMLRATKYTNWGRMLSIATGFVLCVPFLWWAMAVFGLEDAAEKLRPLMFIIMAVYAVEGVIGAWIGIRLFNRRLKHFSFVESMEDA
jgi:hypothetical protein